MRKRLPGHDSGCRMTARLLPVLAALWICLAASAPELSLAATRNAAASAEAGFVTDANPPLLLAAQSKPAQAAPAKPAQSGADVEKLAEERAAKQAEQAGASPAAQKSVIRLLNTVEFRGALKNMPKWQRVVAAEKKSRTFDGDLSALMRPASVYKQWQELAARVRNASDLEKAKAVTAFFNRWPYKTDQMVYKVADYWATPREFMKNSGDCEDYAITKFYALMHLGVDPENMRIVALRDTIRNLAHAVLVIYTNNDAYILDNLTTMVLSHTRYQQYLPQYSINEVYRWAHVRPKKKK